MRLISFKMQKILLFIPYFGLLIVAIIQIINLSRVKDLGSALGTLFKRLCLMYFILGFVYSFFIHPLIYNKDNLELTYIYVVLITYILHIIMGIILLYFHSNEIKQYFSLKGTKN